MRKKDNLSPPKCPEILIAVKYHRALQEEPMSFDIISTKCGRDEHAAGFTKRCQPCGWLLGWSEVF